MRLAKPWGCCRATTWLALCPLVLALPACTGASQRAGHGLASTVQKARPQRIARPDRPAAPTARAAAPAAATMTDADEKERLFRDFLEWQDAQHAVR